ncbi:YraN family protein [uncultured Kiloniella sp.]|uniref:YraN family protein n=1 Tax=uncultured Kiloniella sp. TaxID=1133091 RepID=UPI0026046B50|nr:YraN family protein [uncultured Kiloniella sp.]
MSRFFLNKSKKNSYTTGRYAETIAAMYLRCKGYQILARNYKTKVGEIDLIARRRSLICFLEVKKRHNLETASYAISQTQQKRIIHAAEYFLRVNPMYLDFDKRFDAVLIGATVFPYHIKNAWQVH